MAAATSPATGRTYGVRRIRAIWGVARSSFYDARCQEGRPHQSPVGQPGPKPALSDAELLAAIRRDLARSPWTGEGHRKVWARLRVIDGIRVSRTRCCGSWARTACSPRIAAHPVRPTTTTARSPPMRRT